MNQLFYILIFSLLFTSSAMSEGDAIRNSNGGTVQNLSSGTITVKRKKAVINEGEIVNDGEIIIEEESNVTSEGIVNNSGTIRSFGQISRLNQTSIGGVVIMDTRDGNLTNVPTISYNNLQLRGAGRKIFDGNNSSVGVTSFFSSDTITPIYFTPQQELQTFGEVIHNGRMNPTERHGRVGLYGNSAQQIHGKGFMQHIVLNNPEGADVINGGGFSVTDRLELINGEFRNSVDNNFIIGGDDVQVDIFVQNGSLAIHPENPNSDPVTVTYLQRDEQHTTGGEIPEEGSLLAMSVESSSGLQMTRNVEVDDSLYINGSIKTYETGNQDAQYTLTYNGTENPVFENEYSEIDGSFRRTNLPVGFVNLFNNRYTSARFNSEDDKAGVTSVQMDIRPDTRYTAPEREGDTRVFRTIQIDAADEAGQTVSEGFNMELQYAWIHRPPFGTAGNETFEEGIDAIDEFKLLRWLPEQRWSSITDEDQINTRAANSDWVYSNVFISNTGDFSIGFPALEYLYLMANAILEGPYRPNAGIMDTTVFAQQIQLTPPDIYPYNLDPNRARIEMNPEITGIVDWVVLEFRTEQTVLMQPNDSVFYRTCLLRYDGELVDPIEGTVGVSLPKEYTQSRSGLEIDTTGVEDYYVAIRHRNHLAIVSQNSFFLTRDNISRNRLNFNDPNFVLGGALPKDPEIWDVNALTGTALKIISFDNNGNGIYGIAAGTSGEFKAPDDRWIIDEADFNYVWSNINNEGYFYNGIVNNADYNMDGIVNSLDFNISWNNRKRASEVDRVE